MTLIVKLRKYLYLMVLLYSRQVLKISTKLATSTCTYTAQYNVLYSTYCK